MKTKKLNTYKVTSLHEVSIDSYTEGETGYVNFYELSSEIKAESWKDAIKKYFNEYLCFKFDIEHSYIDEDANNLQYSNLVNSDNMEASENEIKIWKENKLTLYSNNTIITVGQIIKIDLI